MIALIAFLLFIIALPILIPLVGALWPLVKILVKMAGLLLILATLIALVGVTFTTALAGDLRAAIAFGSAAMLLSLVIAFCADRIK
jgi:hypothetical protein